MKVRSLKEYRETRFSPENGKSAPQRKIPKELLLIVVSIMLLVSGLFYYRNEMELRSLRLEMKQIEKEKEELRILYENKKKEMELLTMKEGIEKFARENYNFLKPGEILVVPKSSEKNK